SSLSSFGSLRSETESELANLSESDVDFTALSDPGRLTIHLSGDPHEVTQILALYRSILNWVQSDLPLFQPEVMQTTPVLNPDIASNSSLPALCVMVFLRDDNMHGSERIMLCKKYFEKPPWRFHHSETYSDCLTKISPCVPLDFYYTSENLPLWALRQVHYGKEHIRILLFTNPQTWEQMIRFYKHILTKDAELIRNDFCLFTVHSDIHFDIQFALKRLRDDKQPKFLACATLNVRIRNIGQVLSGLCKVCEPMADNKWVTADHDGNTVVLESMGFVDRSAVDVSKLSLFTETNCEDGFYV
ncbi:hypothetical protein ACJMK2_019289, partial [Sinanodonta woodiana]